MTGHEVPHSAEFAAQDELKTLFESASTWLLAHGEYENPTPDVIPQMVAGLPVREDGEGFTISINGEAIRGLLPDVAARLEVGEEINLAHTLPYMERQVGLIYDRVAPYVMFAIKKLPTAVSHEEHLWLCPDDDGYESDRMRTPNLGIHRPSASDVLAQAHNPGAYVRYIKNTFAEMELGINRLTHGECQDLQQIVDNLDVLVQA